MRKIGLTLGLVLVLGGNAMACRCCCWGFWPSFSIGFGLGGLFGCSVGLGPGCYCGWGCGHPAYSYAYPGPAYPYAYAPPATYLDPPAAALGPVKAPEPTPWVPSTPGAGRWVPDPAPYSYTPAPSAPKPAEAKAPLRQVVTSTCSPEGIPVYTITYVK
jgi:hypothetical protein